MSDVTSRALFGEISLLFGGERTATVRTLESCHVIHIEKEVFDRYIKEPLLKKLGAIQRYYKSLSFFEQIDASTLLILASKTRSIVLQSNTLVVR